MRSVTLLYCFSFYLPLLHHTNPSIKAEWNPQNLSLSTQYLQKIFFKLNPYFSTWLRMQGIPWLNLTIGKSLQTGYQSIGLTCPCYMTV